MKTFSAATLCAAAFAAENTAPVISLSLDAYQPTHDGHGTDSENHNLCGNSTTAVHKVAALWTSPKPMAP
jgi:hypothetical protein